MLEVRTQEVSWLVSQLQALKELLEFNSSLNLLCELMEGCNGW